LDILHLYSRTTIDRSFPGPHGPQNSKQADKQNQSLNQFMKDLAVSGNQKTAPPAWREEDDIVSDEEDEEEETEDIYGGWLFHLIS